MLKMKAWPAALGLGGRDGRPREPRDWATMWNALLTGLLYAGPRGLP